VAGGPTHPRCTDETCEFQVAVRSMFYTIHLRFPSLFLARNMDSGTRWERTVVGGRCKGASIKYVRTEGEGGGVPKAYIVREVA